MLETLPSGTALLIRHVQYACWIIISNTSVCNLVACRPTVPLFHLPNLFLLIASPLDDHKRKL